MPISTVDAVPVAKRASKVEQIKELAELRKILEKPLVKTLKVDLGPESLKLYKKPSLAVTSFVMKVRAEFKNVRIQVRNGTEIYVSPAPKEKK